MPLIGIHIIHTDSRWKKTGKVCEAASDRRKHESFNNEWRKIDSSTSKTIIYTEKSIAACLMPRSKAFEESCREVIDRRSIVLHIRIGRILNDSAAFNKNKIDFDWVARDSRAYVFCIFLSVAPSFLPIEANQTNMLRNYYDYRLLSIVFQMALHASHQFISRASI